MDDDTAVWWVLWPWRRTNLTKTSTEKEYVSRENENAIKNTCPWWRDNFKYHSPEANKSQKVHRNIYSRAFLLLIPTVKVQWSIVTEGIRWNYVKCRQQIVGKTSGKTIWECWARLTCASSIQQDALEQVCLIIVENCVCKYQLEFISRLGLRKGHVHASSPALSMRWCMCSYICRTKTCTHTRMQAQTMHSTLGKVQIISFY